MVANVGCLEATMNKHEQTSINTKQNLIDAFWSLYCEKRIEKITVREIMQKAGYNRGTFYEYFVDVHDVLEQIENSLLPNISELPPMNFTTETAQPIDGFVKLYSENSKYYTVLLGDKGDPAFANKLKNYVKLNVLGLLVSKGIQNDAKLDFSIEFVLSAMIGILTYWFANEKSISEKDLVELVSSLMNEGVSKVLGTIIL